MRYRVYIPPPPFNIVVGTTILRVSICRGLDDDNHRELYLLSGVTEFEFDVPDDVPWTGDASVILRAVALNVNVKWVASFDVSVEYSNSTGRNEVIELTPQRLQEDSPMDASSEVTKLMNSVLDVDRSDQWARGALADEYEVLGDTDAAECLRWMVLYRRYPHNSIRRNRLCYSFRLDESWPFSYLARHYCEVSPLERVASRWYTSRRSVEADVIREWRLLARDIRDLLLSSGCV